METTEKIVEAYVRYVKGWATIPNIKCHGQYEIDLIAIDLCNLDRYHIESGVSISGSYSKLTDKEYSSERLKVRVAQAGQRRTIGYFAERKFGSPEILKELNKYGFKRGNYKKIIVSWGWTEGAAEKAKNEKIILWDFRDILNKIAEECVDLKTYFTDDTLRTLQLFIKSKK